MGSNAYKSRNRGNNVLPGNEGLASLGAVVSSSETDLLVGEILRADLHTDGNTSLLPVVVLPTSSVVVTLIDLSTNTSSLEGGQELFRLRSGNGHRRHTLALRRSISSLEVLAV